MKRKNKQAFTLIELLVVISIIGILVTLVSVSFIHAQKQARDTERKSDLKQYQNALESFANGNNSLFPSHLNAQKASVALCNSLNAYFDPDITCPEDPRDTSIYKYQTPDGSGGGTANATKYVLWATLEAKTNTVWVVCSNGRAFEATSAPSGGTCP